MSTDFVIHKMDSGMRPGRMFSNRLKIKAFKSSDNMHEFLNKQTDNDWEQHGTKGEAQGYPKKAGTYAFAGGAWHNVRSLDPSVLAHI